MGIKKIFLYRKQRLRILIIKEGTRQRTFKECISVVKTAVQSLKSLPSSFVSHSMTGINILCNKSGNSFQNKISWEKWNEREWKEKEDEMRMRDKEVSGKSYVWLNSSRLPSLVTHSLWLLHGLSSPSINRRCEMSNDMQSGSSIILNDSKLGKRGNALRGSERKRSSSSDRLQIIKEVLF